MGGAFATTACSLSVIKLNPCPAGAAGGPGTKRGVRTGVVTGSRNETGIGTEKILMVGRVQGRPEDTESAPGAETGTGNGQGPGRWSGTETDTADLASVSLQALSFIIRRVYIRSHSYCIIIGLDIIFTH